MEKDKLLKHITCPLTDLIFCDPVLASDGKFYELTAIKNHLSKNINSPTTGEKLDSTLLKAPEIKKIVDDFITNNPEYTNDKFLFRKPFYLFTKDFHDLLKNKKYDQLKEFTSIMLNTEFNRETLFSIICQNCPTDIIKYVIDNSLDYDSYDRNKLKPLHIACKYAPDEVIIHLAQKGVDLNAEDLYGETPMGYAIIYRKEYQSAVTKLIGLGANINKMNKSGMTIAHYLITNNDLETLKLCINYNLNMSTISNKLGGINLLQFAFKEANEDIIKYLIDLNTCLDIDIDPKTPSEYLIYMNKNLDKKQKQLLVLHYLTKLLNKPIIIENFMSN